MFSSKVVLKIFTKRTRKHLCHILFFNKVKNLRDCFWRIVNSCPKKLNLKCFTGFWIRLRSGGWIFGYILWNHSFVNVGWIEEISISMSFRGVLPRRCSENIQQIYRTPMLKYDSNKAAKQLQLYHRCFSLSYPQPWANNTVT